MVFLYRGRTDVVSLKNWADIILCKISACMTVNFTNDLYCLGTCFEHITVYVGGGSVSGPCRVANRVIIPSKA